MTNHFPALKQAMIKVATPHCDLDKWIGIASNLATMLTHSARPRLVASTIMTTHCPPALKQAMATVDATNRDVDE